jgi:PAS domain S-box-containing protein
MKRRTSIVWKLSTVVILVVSATLMIAAGVDHLVADHYFHELAQTIFRFDAQSTVDGLADLLMLHSTEAVGAYFHNLSRDSDIYSEFSLISHKSGEIVASLKTEPGTRLPIESRGCASCHAFEDPSIAGLIVHNEIIEDAQGNRSLSVLTPILNRPACLTAACHAHSESGVILGFLQTEYSLELLDPSIAHRSTYTLLVAGCAVALSALTLAFVFMRILRRPIQELIAGTRRLAEGDRDFRFPAERHDEMGELERAFNTMTSRINAHDSRLHEVLEHLEGVIENSADIIITVSLDHRIQTFNKGAEQALGYSREEVIGQRMRKLFARPEDRDAALKILENTDHVRNFGTQFRTKSGKLRDVLLTLSRLHDRDGNQIGTFGISKDVTEEKQLLRQLIQSKKLAAIGQVVTGILHATKNMLSALQGGAYLVRTGMRDGNQERLNDGWEMVEDGIQRISGLSRSMLNYVREWRPDLEDSDLNDVVLGVMDAMNQSASDRGVTLRSVRVDGLSTVRCDPKLIRTAIMDIASNAIDACELKEYGEEETPEVLLKVYPQDDSKCVVIEISDNGCGMDKDTTRRVFEPFFSTKEQWGTGIGLAMTSRVIEVHGGRCEVDSEIGKGSTFQVVLPVGGPKHGKE